MMAVTLEAVLGLGSAAHYTAAFLWKLSTCCPRREHPTMPRWSALLSATKTWSSWKNWIRQKVLGQHGEKPRYFLKSKGGLNALQFGKVLLALRCRTVLPNATPSQPPPPPERWHHLRVSPLDSACRQRREKSQARDVGCALCSYLGRQKHG